jgi:hypothetical protein
MTKKNEIMKAKAIQVDVRRSVQSMLAQRVNDGTLAHRVNSDLTVRFSNRQAIDTVCKAIQVECNPSATPEEKKAAALFATEIAIHSDTAGEEVQRLIEQMQANIMDG